MLLMLYFILRSSVLKKEVKSIGEYILIILLTKLDFGTSFV